MRIMQWMLAAAFLAGSVANAGEYSEERIALPGIAVSEYWNCSDPGLWYCPDPDRPRAAITRRDDGIGLAYAGNTVWTRAGYRYSLTATREALPLQRGPAGEVRVNLDIAVRELEFHAEIMPVLLFSDASGRALGRMDFYPFDFQQYCNTVTAPGHYRRLSRTFAPPSEAATVALGFEQRGNRSDLLLHMASLEPAPDKRTAVVPKAGRVPAVQYWRSDEQPTPDVELVTDAEVDELLRQRPTAVPKLERRNDRMMLTVNGEELPFAVSFSPASGLDRAYVQNMERAGFRLHTIRLRTGPYADSPGAPSGIWRGPDEYDFRAVAMEIRKFLRRVPDGYLLLDLNINVPNAWGERYPDDIHVNAQGEKGVANGCRVIRYGGAPPSGPEYYEASNHSERFREDGRRLLEALGRYLNAVPEGKVVIGAYLNGSADGQWLFSNEAEFADYSPAAMAHFRRFLREKYGSREALRQAWGGEVDFDTVAFPGRAERGRMAGDPDLPRFPLLSIPGTEARCSDFNEFLSVSNNRRQIAFAEGLKRGSDGRLLTGMYWPTLPASYPLSHNRHREILETPAIDFIARGGMLGAVFHDKIPVAELDLRNLLSGLDIWVDYDHPFHAKSQAEFRRQTLASVAHQLAAGGGFHYWDMWGGWAWHPETLTILREAVALTAAVHDQPALGEDYVGVFIDDRTPDYLMTLGQYWNAAAVEQTTRGMGANGVAMWSKTGLPVRFLVLEDAWNPVVPPPRVAIFLNPLTLTATESRQIRERLERDGRTVVYLTAPGVAAPGGEANPELVTGFALYSAPETVNRGIEILPVADPLLEGLRPGMVLGLYSSDMLMDWTTSWAARPDSPGTVLARYPGTDLAGMLVARDGAATRVWIGAPGALSPRLVRNFARAAGLEPLSESDGELIYGAGMLGLAAPPAGGSQELRIPTGMRVTGSLSGHVYTIRDRMLRFDAVPADIYGDVALFALETDEAKP